MFLRMLIFVIIMLMKRIVLIVLLLIIALFVLSVFMILNRSTKPLSEAQKQQALTKILGRKINLTEKAAPQGDLGYKGTYISFVYPASAKIIVPMINGKVQEKSGLDQFSFSFDSPSIYTFIEVVKANSNVLSLTDYPSVRIRQIQPEIYKETVITTNNQQGLSFEKHDNSGFEKTAFFFVNGRIYSFSVMGGNLKAIEVLFNKTILSVKFL